MIDPKNLLEAVKSGNIQKVYPVFQDNVSLDEIHCAFHWAVRLGYQDIIQLLIDHGANVNFVDFNGFTPVIWSVIFSPDISVLDLLIKQKANVNHASTKRRQTALHAAAIRGQADLVKLLLENGADVDVYDYLHKTPLLHATSKGHVDCVKVLLQFNCSVDVTGVIQGEAMTPLFCALINSNLEIVRMLILAGAHFMKSAIYQTVTIEQFYKTVEESLNLVVRPVYLQQQCRNCLRQVLRPDFIKKLQRLSGILPQPMHGYLSLSEFDNRTNT